MKEAAGEANMTVVTIILIGVVVAVATPLVSGLMETTKKRSDCTEQGLCYNKVSGQCDSCETTTITTETQ